MNKLLDRLIHAEFDAEYYRMKYRGTWPSDNPPPPVVWKGWVDPKDWKPNKDEGPKGQN